MLGFWSIAISYAGVTTLFLVTKWKARLWFVALPTLVYMLAFGLIIAMFTFVGQGEL